MTLLVDPTYTKILWRDMTLSQDPSLARYDSFGKPHQAEQYYSPAFQGLRPRSLAISSFATCKEEVRAIASRPWGTKPSSYLVTPGIFLGSIRPSFPRVSNWSLKYGVLTYYSKNALSGERVGFLWHCLQWYGRIDFARMNAALLLMHGACHRVILLCHVSLCVLLNLSTFNTSIVVPECHTIATTVEHVVALPWWP